jgi:hypothetical protein
MTRLKSLLKRVDVETAKGKRTCKNSGEKILKGDKCIVVFDGMHDHSPYCRSVALQMIAAARTKLDEFEAMLQ